MKENSQKCDGDHVPEIAACPSNAALFCDMPHQPSGTEERGLSTWQLFAALSNGRTFLHQFGRMAEPISFVSTVWSIWGRGVR